MGIECFRVQFPKGMDANEYALKTQPAAKSAGGVADRRGVDGQRRAASGPRAGSGDRGRASQQQRSATANEEEPARSKSHG